MTHPENSRHPNTYRSRVWIAAVVSLVFHALGATALVESQWLARLTAPKSGPDSVIELETQPPEKSPRPEPTLIEEPIRETQVAEIRSTPAPAPPSLDLHYQRPSVEPVALRIPAPTRQPVRTPHPTRPPDNRPEADRTMPRHNDAPSAEKAPQTEAEQPELPLYPQSPPPELIGSLPPGGVRQSSFSVAMTAEDRQALVQKVYNQQRYPTEAAEFGIEGAVSVRFRLDRSGKPLSIEAVDAAGEADPLLIAEARRMVEAGAPYPIPALRRTLTFYIAVACLRPGDSDIVRCEIVRSSQHDALDAHALNIAKREAKSSGRVGWLVLSFPFTATVEQLADNEGNVQAQLHDFQGDEHWRALVGQHLSDLVRPWKRTGYLLLPVEFKLD